MKKWSFSIVLLLLVAGSTFAADAAAPKSATVGGGVQNPWRSPYKTALVIELPGLNP